MIGIIGAMDMEINGLRAAMQSVREEQVGSLTFYCGALGREEIVLVKSGVGKVFAALCAQTMILQYHPQYIINTGVAGALHPDLHIAAIVVGSAAVQHDMDTSALGDPVGLISGMNLIEIPTDQALSEQLSAVAQSLGIQTAAGVIASGDQFIGATEEKQRIAEQFHAIACEMEGGAIAQVCRANDVPFALLRAISDGAGGDGATDYTAFAKLAADQSIRLLSAFLR